MTVVYVDLLFLLNFVANYLLLLGSGRVTGSILRRWRLAAGAAFGALYAVAVFLPGCQWLSAWLCKLASGVIIALIAYGGEPGLLKVTVFFFAASAALAGMVLGVELLGGNSLTIQNGVFYSYIDLRLLLLLFVLCYFILSLFFRRLGRHSGRELVRVELTLDGKTVELTALRDSGHTLTDPVTNKPVIIADQRYFAAFLPKEITTEDPIEGVKRCHKLGIKGARLIPYRAVGVNCGMLLALRMESSKIAGKSMGNLLVALSPNPVDDGGGYQALIGGTQE